MFGQINVHLPGKQQNPADGISADPGLWNVLDKKCFTKSFDVQHRASILSSCESLPQQFEVRDAGDRLSEEDGRHRAPPLLH